LALLVTYIHALELLTQYGCKSFYTFLKSYTDNKDKTKSGQQVAKILQDISSTAMSEFYAKFQSIFNTPTPTPLPLRHPKLVKLEKIILDHFNGPTTFGQTTRVMIFTQYRESVYEIVEILSAHAEIKAMEFVGQSAVTSTRKSVSQKEQLEVVKKFREGGYNTLVSTCVGEEGLDIGEVDLIVCYDAQKSPIRLIQRMGRTGRKRQGCIAVLVSAGREEQAYNASLAKKNSMYRIITNGSRNFKFYQNNPVMIPAGVEPRCHKLFLQAAVEKEPEVDLKNKRKSKDGVKVKELKKDSNKEEKKKKGTKEVKKGRKSVNNKKVREVVESDLSCMESFVAGSQLPDLDLGGGLSKEKVNDLELNADVVDETVMDMELENQKYFKIFRTDIISLK